MDLITVTQLNYLERLKGIDLAIQNHRLVGIIGPNGAGKSTLLRCMAGLLMPCSGEITLQGQPLSNFERKSLARLLSWIPQNAEIGWPISVHDAVTIGAMHQPTPEGATAHALSLCNLEPLAQRPLSELSGGELARVWVARALANKPKLLLADEPIAALDLKYQLEVMQLFKNFSKRDGLAVVVLHDINLAARFCDDIILLDHGELVAFGPTSEVLNCADLSRVFDVTISQTSLNNQTLFSADANDK